MNKIATEITLAFAVSEGDHTLQAFDYLSQTLSKFLKQDDVDRLLLCQLLETMARSQQWQNSPLPGMLSQAPVSNMVAPDNVANNSSSNPQSR